MDFADIVPSGVDELWDPSFVKIPFRSAEGAEPRFVSLLFLFYYGCFRLYLILHLDSGKERV